MTIPYGVRQIIVRRLFAFRRAVELCGSNPHLARDDFIRRNVPCRKVGFGRPFVTVCSRKGCIHLHRKIQSPQDKTLSPTFEGIILSQASLCTNALRRSELSQIQASDHRHRNLREARLLKGNHEEGDERFDSGRLQLIPTSVSAGSRLWVCDDPNYT